MDSKKSRAFAAPENIRPQILTPDFFAGDVFDSWPPLGVEQDFVRDPIGNGLLADGGAVQEIGDALCKGGLIPGNFDCTLKSGDMGSNVRFIHDRREYTNQFVKVNNPVCVTHYKEPCIVLKMPATKRKQAVKTAAQPKKRRKAIPGPDGKTLGQRVAEAMAHESGRRHAEYRQVDLVSDVNKLANIPEDQQGKTQQSISAIQVGTVSRSWLTPFIAKACHVDALWLANGAGKMLD